MGANSSLYSFLDYVQDYLVQEESIINRVISCRFAVVTISSSNKQHFKHKLKFLVSKRGCVMQTKNTWHRANHIEAKAIFSPRCNKG